MRKLVYLFLMYLLLVGCRDNRFNLNQAKTWWEVNPDSMLYYLQKVDSASLTPEQALDYQLYRIRASYAYLMSMKKEKLDSIAELLKHRYPMGHEWAFDARYIQLVYYYNRLDDKKTADSMANELKRYLLTHRDSVYWYRYKYLHKYHQKETDSAFHYLNEAAKLRLLSERDVYSMRGDLYQIKQQKDSAAWYYLKTLELDSTTNVFHLSKLVVNLLSDEKEIGKASELLEKVRKRMKRSDIPYYNLVKGDYWMEMHEPDSAMKHYRIATETGNGFIAVQAYERMGMLAKDRQSEKEAFDMYRKAQRVRNDIYMSMDNKHNTQSFEALKIKNQLNELKVERQRHVILILGLALLVFVLIGSFVFYLFHRKRMAERAHLMQENVMLKQQEELSNLREKEALLREKDARMREELFKRMNVFKKLSDTEKEKHIQLSDTDWKELQLMLDSGYNGFAQKLRTGFPMLSEKDINFCCLVKINMSIQNLTDIYCISKNSVSRRKLRLKEKLGIGEGDTLDEFLKEFE